MLATAHVGEYLPRRLGCFLGQAASLDGISNVDEVTPLIAILIDQRGFPLRKRDVKMADTPVYGVESACRGPKTLKKRKATVGIPYARPIIRHSCYGQAWKGHK